MADGALLPLEGPLGDGEPLLPMMARFNLQCLLMPKDENLTKNLSFDWRSKNILLCRRLSVLRIRTDTKTAFKASCSAWVGGWGTLEH